MSISNDGSVGSVMNKENGATTPAGQPGDTVNQQPYAPQSYPQQPYPPQQPYVPQGYPQQPYPQQPYAPQGYPQQPYPPQQPYAPQGYPPQPYAPQGYPQQPYAPQPYAPQGYPQQPYPPQQPYAPQSYPQQPYPPRYPQRSRKTGTNALPLAIVYTAAIVLQVLLSNFILGIGFGGQGISGIISPLLHIAAGVLLILGVHQHSKTGNTLFAAGLIIIAANIIFNLCISISHHLFFDVVSVVMVLALGISGAATLVNKKPLDTIKRISMIILIAVVIIEYAIINIYYIGGFHLAYVLESILEILAYAALGICTILFKPFHQV